MGLSLVALLATHKTGLSSHTHPKQQYKLPHAKKLKRFIGARLSAHQIPAQGRRKVLANVRNRGMAKQHNTK